MLILITTLESCKYSEYGEWSKCSKTCGGGVRTSKREILHEAKFGGDDCIGYVLRTENCNVEACPGSLQVFYPSSNRMFFNFTGFVFCNTQNHVK